MFLNCKWRTIEGARRAGQRDARAGKPMRSGPVAFPGSYADAWRAVHARPKNPMRLT